MRRWQIKLLVILSVAVIGISAFWYNLQYTDVDMYTAMFADHCGDCHGEDMRGTETGVALIERRLESGDTVAAMMHSIRSSHAEGGLPAFQNLNEDQVKGLAIYVGERRLGQKFEATDPLPSQRELSLRLSTTSSLKSLHRTSTRSASV